MSPQNGLNESERALLRKILWKLFSLVDVWRLYQYQSQSIFLLTCCEPSQEFLHFSDSASNYVKGAAQDHQWDMNHFIFT